MLRCSCFLYKCDLHQVLLQVEALDLNPGVAKIDPTTRKMFNEFKAETKKKQQ